MVIRYTPYIYDKRFVSANVGVGLHYYLKPDKYLLEAAGKQLEKDRASVVIDEMVAFVDESFLDYAINPDIQEIFKVKPSHREYQTLRAKVGQSFKY